MNRSTQTNISTEESLAISDLNFSIADVEKAEGFKNIEEIHNEDTSASTWAELIVKQIYVRDVLIKFILSKFENLFLHSKTISEDLDYIKLKNFELKQQIKSLKKKAKLKNIKCESKGIQTVDDWNDWYQWYNQYYYSNSTYNDNTQQCNNGDNLQHERSVLKSDSINLDLENKIETKCNESNKGKGDKAANEIIVDCNSTNPKEKVNALSENNSISGEQAIIHDSNNLNNSERIGNDVNKHKLDQIKTNRPTVEACKNENTSNVQEVNSAIIIDNKCDCDNEITNVEENTESEIEKINIFADDTTTELQSDLCKSVEKMDVQTNKDQFDTKTCTVEENNVLCDVETVAQVDQVTHETNSSSSYVYDEEAGQYYDPNSGYYYNAENGLYYDGTTGTYFYYDYEQQQYVFHSMISTNSEAAAKGENGKIQVKNIKEDKQLLSTDEIAKTVENFEAAAADSEVEEGECSESEEEKPMSPEEYEILDDYYISNCTSIEASSTNVVSKEAIAPSLRLMVIDNGNNEDIKEGSLHLVTITGGSIGREKHNDVYLPDVNISKTHAAIIYQSNGDDDHHYFIKDLGSNNGTFVNGKRISHNRNTSNFVEIGHGWKIKIGQVILGCHVHPGYLTCTECEPGLFVSKAPADSKKNIKIEEKRLKKLKRLKRKYGLEFNENPSFSLPSGYNDRAESRRTKIGSDNPYEKTEVSHVDLPLNKKNKGFTLLEKMGWSEGKGIGKHQSGILEPIQPDYTVNKTGLGATSMSNVPLSAKEEKKMKNQEITKKRYLENLQSHPKYKQQFVTFKDDYCKSLPEGADIDMKQFQREWKEHMKNYIITEHL